jgi:hypothetical protein
MFDRFNHALNVIIAIILMISPHFFHDHGISPGQMRKAMAEAEKHAQYIMETGDTTELAGLETAMAEMQKYQPLLDRVMPVLEQAALQMPAATAEQGTQKPL